MECRTGWLWSEFCSPKNFYIENLTLAVTVFGAQACKDVIMVKWSYVGGLESNKTDDFIRTGRDSRAVGRRGKAR